MKKLVIKKKVITNLERALNEPEPKEAYDALCKVYDKNKVLRGGHIGDFKQALRYLMGETIEKSNTALFL